MPGFGSFLVYLGDSGPGFWQFVPISVVLVLGSILAYFVISGPGLDHFWPISGVLGMELSQLVPFLGDSEPGLGHFGLFRGFCAWIWAILDLF